MDAVRHHRCRSIASAPLHGFTLRASPAVKHGVSPPGTVDERARGCSAHLHPRISYMVLRILSLTAGLSHPPPHRAASGGGAPCVTAGDTRAERGGTRGKARGNPWKSEGEPVKKRGGTREKADSTNLRRRWRRTESVEGKTRIGSSGGCATPPVSEYSFSPSPRVHPSGITRG